MTEPERLLTKNVFVAGRSPGVTYNPRNDRQLEAEVNSYLSQGPGKALSISGPTKSGKTVLVERLLPEYEAIWMQGSDLGSVECPPRSLRTGTPFSAELRTATHP